MARSRLHSVITADEAWFYLSSSRDGQWALCPGDVPVRVKDSIASKKVMIFIAWNPHGPLLVEALPEGTRFDSSFIRDVLIEKLDSNLKMMG